MYPAALLTPTITPKSYIASRDGSGTETASTISSIAGRAHEYSAASLCRSHSIVDRSRFSYEQGRRAFSLGEGAIAAQYLLEILDFADEDAVLEVKRAAVSFITSALLDGDFKMAFQKANGAEAIGFYFGERAFEALYVLDKYRDKVDSSDLRVFGLKAVWAMKQVVGSRRFDSSLNIFLNELIVLMNAALPSEKSRAGVKRSRVAWEEKPIFSNSARIAYLAEQLKKAEPRSPKSIHIAMRLYALMASVDLSEIKAQVFLCFETLITHYHSVGDLWSCFCVFRRACLLMQKSDTSDVEELSGVFSLVATVLKDHVTQTTVWLDEALKVKDLERTKHVYAKLVGQFQFFASLKGCPAAFTEEMWLLFSELAMTFVQNLLKLADYTHLAEYITRIKGVMPVKHHSRLEKIYEEASLFSLIPYNLF